MRDVLGVRRGEIVWVRDFRCGKGGRGWMQTCWAGDLEIVFCSVRIFFSSRIILESLVRYTRSKFLD